MALASSFCNLVLRFNTLTDEPDNWAFLPHGVPVMTRHLIRYSICSDVYQENVIMITILMLISLMMYKHTIHSSNRATHLMYGGGHIKLVPCQDDRFLKLLPSPVNLVCEIWPQIFPVIFNVEKHSCKKVRVYSWHSLYFSGLEPFAVTVMPVASQWT